MNRRAWLGVLIIGVLVIGTAVFPASAAPITGMRDQLSREAVGVAANHTIRATFPTGITTTGGSFRLVFPTGFVFPALTPSDVSLTYGPVTGEESQPVIASTPAISTWGVTFSGTTITFTVPTNPLSAGIQNNDRVIIKVGNHTPLGSQRITNPASAGIYRIIIDTATEDGSIYVPIALGDGMTITAVVPGPESGGGDTGGGGGPVGTPGGDPVTPPAPTFTITNLRAEEIGPTQATILWTTSAAADGQLEYGQTIAYGGIQTEARGSVTSHRVVLTGLTADRTYYVLARSRSGTVTVTNTISFRTTRAPRAPLISNARVTSISDRGATILFDTDIDAIGTAIIAPIGGGGGQTLTEGAAIRSHALTVTGLRPGTPYGVTLTGREFTGLISAPVVVNFSTTEDRTPPSNPSGVTAVGLTRSIRLTWTSPPFEDGDFIMIRARTDRVPVSITDGRLVYSGRASSIIDDTLLDDTFYYYTLFAVDASNNASSGAVTGARTLLPPPPAPPREPVTPPEDSRPPVAPPTTPPRDPAEPVRPTAPPPAPTTPPTGPISPTLTPTTPPSSPSDPRGGDGRGGDDGRVTPVTPSPAPTGVPIPLVPVPDAGAPTTGPVAVLTPLTGPDAVGAETGVGMAAIDTRLRDEERLPEQTQLHVYVANGALELLPQQGVRTVLTSRSLAFRLSVLASGSTPTGGQLRVGETTYLLVARPEQGVWEAMVMAPAAVADTIYEVQLSYADGSRRREVGTIRTRAYGIVREGALVRRVDAPVIGEAVIEIRRADGTIWPAGPFQEQNPLTTGADGMFGYMLPNGSYGLRVSKAGFRSFERRVDVRDQVLALPIMLTRELTSLADLFGGEKSPGEQARALLQEASILAQIGRDFTETPEAQEAAKSVVAPTAAVATAAVTATAVSSASAVTYARFIFTQPLLLIRRRKRKRWGTVYNALSKQPIELAIVRLVHATSGIVVQTRITDAQGRFSFSVPPGQYRVQVMKPAYTFPSSYLKDEKEDGDFLDLYHGELIASQEGALLTPNIPVDPIVKEEPSAKIIWKSRFRKLQNGLGIIGTVVSIGTFFIAPSWLTGGLFALQVATYGLFRRLALPPKPKDWGIAYDTTNKAPLEKAIIRVFDKKFNKLLETQITDQKGKYGFFAAKGLYYVTAEKIGYDKYTSQDIDLRHAKETVIDQRVGLTKQKK